MTPKFVKNSTETERLSRLRAKTNSQVLDFIESKLEAASRFAAVAEVNGADVQESLNLAEAELTEARRLLQIFDESENRGLDRKLNQLTETVDRIRGLRPIFLTAPCTAHLRSCC